MKTLSLLVILLTSACVPICPEPENLPLLSGSYALSPQAGVDDRAEFQRATVVYDREAGELSLTYVDADGREVVQELEVGAIEPGGG
jgi:hypothetical protein